jgi:hypothetical protein
MKINGNDEIIKNGFADKTLRRQQDRKDDFKNILKASVERTKPDTEKIQSSPLANRVSAIRFQAPSAENKRLTIEHVDNLLNLLDNYRIQLADPQVTLRSMEPVIKMIDKEKEQLSSVLDSLAEADELKDIVNRTLVTASLEVMKYNRGDYIAS